ncbi:MAG: hypothetical protein ACK5RQ_01995 [Bacteroidota bacterium]|jgi:hypothetical protein
MTVGGFPNLRLARITFLSMMCCVEYNAHSSRKVAASGGRLRGEEKTLIVFGLWQLVFGSIISTGMNILPKTKDYTLKTGTVFPPQKILLKETKQAPPKSLFATKEQRTLRLERRSLCIMISK